MWTDILHVIRLPHVPAASGRTALPLARGLSWRSSSCSGSARSAARRPGRAPAASLRPCSQAARYEARRGPAPDGPAETAGRGGGFRRARASRRRLSLRHRRQHPRALGIPADAHRLVGAADARAGDIVFFDTRGAARAGVRRPDRHRRERRRRRPDRLRRGARRPASAASFVDPAHPPDRRGARGEILNSFLRPIRIDDPPGTRYFAGEMLCGIARTR